MTIDRRVRSMALREHSSLRSMAQTAEWVVKAMLRSRPLLDLAGDVADPAEVIPYRSDDPRDWAYGNFMLAWLDASGPVRCVRHLPDASFFLKLLKNAYQPVLAEHPEFIQLLEDSSRPEMSLTNDVLQIQLRGLEVGAGYSMVRQHALMLFHAALWLEEPRRSQWLSLYDAIVDHVDARPGGRPSLEELAAIEKGAFEDFVALAPLTLDTASSNALLDSDHLLQRIYGYQLYAAVAIGLLWREYRALDAADIESWHREQLSSRYLQVNYLEEEWMTTL